MKFSQQKLTSLADRLLTRQQSRAPGFMWALLLFDLKD